MAAWASVVFSSTTASGLRFGAVLSALAFPRSVVSAEGNAAKIRWAKRQRLHPVQRRCLCTGVAAQGTEQVMGLLMRRL